VLEGEDRQIARPEAIKWVAGRDAKQKALSLQTSPALEIPAAGDFESDQGFTASIWVKLVRRNQTGAIMARMDNGNQYRGWDIWLEGDKVGTHIINKWQDDALKVVSKNPLKVNEWTHVCVTYDGSKKASGVTVYYNGKPQPVNIAADKLQGSIRTTVPFKIGQRHTDQKLQNMTVYDLRLFRRGLSALEASQLVLGEEIEGIVARPANERTPEQKTKANDWWLASMDMASREIGAQIRALQQAALSPM
jgi:hypothetical protein